MPFVTYVFKKFKPDSRARIGHANAIIEEYADQGFALTLRQLYYQFVSRDLLPNTVQSYKNLGTLISDARLAGLVDWDSIEDRTRAIRELAHWDSPSEIVTSCARQYRVAKWDWQTRYVEVWIEKDALVGVIEGVCRELDVPYFSCRGYTSQSEMWVAGQRLIGKEEAGKETIILHLGDHDPSGIDMTRDIRDRLELFGSTVDVRRIALTQDQLDEYEPPPNPAKVTDSRYAKYAAEYGEESWELDALEPAVLRDLISDTVGGLIDRGGWDLAVKKEKADRRKLRKVAREMK